MSTAIPKQASPEPQTLTEWALSVLALTPDHPAPAPPFHERLTHLAQVLGLGAEGYRFLALFFGVWRSPDLHGPLTAAQARLAAGDTPAEMRNTLIWWEILTETAIAPGAPLALSLDETIGDWLDGGNPIPPRWHDRISVRVAPPPLPHWPMQDLVARASAALGDPEAGPLVVTLTGPPGSGGRSLVAAVCAQLGTEAFEVDLRDLAPPDALALIRIAERAALLGLRPAIYVGGAGVTVPDATPVLPLRFFRSFDGTGPTLPGTPHRVELGPLPHAERASAWATLCAGFTEWPESDQAKVCALKPATVGDISAVAATAPATAGEALAALRQRQIARLDPRIQPIPAQLGWRDLILPERLHSALQRLSAEIRLSPALWDDPAAARLYPRGRGVFALFSGPSGTGKTMAAEVIAHDLGVDLYVVDTGAIVSKYVGETAHNLQTVFAQAEHDAAVLFFDEADGVFGKRTEARDAHARYLNSDTNVLLRAVESYSGGCILATNRRDNVDPAFLRRLRAVMEFPRPDSAQRLRLWAGLTQALAHPSEDLSQVFQRLADGLDFTGAQIKNAVRTALIEARRDGRSVMTAADLLTGADHELLKEGRALSPAEMARLSGGGA